MAVKYVVILDADGDATERSVYECETLEVAVGVANSAVRAVATTRVYRVAESLPLEVATETELVPRTREFVRVAASPTTEASSG